MHKDLLNQENTDVLILGGGPAGYTAAIYTARAGLETFLYEGPQPGGLLTTTTDVDNYPGYPNGINGTEMMENFKKQALRFGVFVRPGKATSVDFNNFSKQKVTIDEKQIVTSSALIIATGASAKRLGIPSEQRLFGKGVSTCAVCDGFFFKNQDVAVVGGGNTALEEAIYLSKICKKVYLLVRKGTFRATDIIQKQLTKKPNIEVLWHTEAKKILGENAVEGVRIFNNQTNQERNITLQGFFLAIGHTPNTQIFPDHLPIQNSVEKIELKDKLGYIKTIPGSARTNIPGIFAAGDVQDSKYRQAITSAASGCMAALDAEHYLQTKI